MSLFRALRPRMVVLFLLWVLPLLCYLAIGFVAMYQTGWLGWVVWTLPFLWLLAWGVGRLWPSPKLSQVNEGKPLKAPDFWTPTDAAAIAVVEQYSTEVNDVDSKTVADFNRFIGDAQVLADRLAKHYYSDGTLNALHPLTLVEILAVVHLAVEDLEAWVLESVPGSDLATIGHFGKVPSVVGKIDTVQKIVYFASAVANPSKLLAYPLWRKSGQVVGELQNELVRSFYHRYLRQVGYYLIEMYSGRLRGGSKAYRMKFGKMAAAVHEVGGDTTRLESLEDTETTIAVMGQVKAGKSSLINALTNDQVAATSVLPETRLVKRYQFSLPGSVNKVTLLDTPGYDEADVSRSQQKEIQKAIEAADIVLLVLDAHSPARQADVAMVQALAEHSKANAKLRPPAVIAVLTHIDLLRPVREWEPPYDWQNPHQLKEESIAASVAYVKELLGPSIDGYACVYTGDEHPDGTSVIDEVVPQIIAHLDAAMAAAILKAFYKQLDQERLAQLSSQVIGLFKTVLGRR
ncbi:GTPase family protein [Novipirellula herctigrandis]